MTKKKSAKKKTKKKVIRPKGITSAISAAKSRSNVRSAGEIAQAQTATAKSSPTITPYPTAGRKILEFEEKLDRQLGDEAPAKRLPGRPRKEAEQQPPEIDIKVIGQAIEIPFDLWAIKQGIPDLKITTNESIMIAKPLKELLDHYVPQVPVIAWAWISLGAVSYSIMKSRLVLVAEIKKARPSSIEQPAGGKDSTRRRGQGGPLPAVFPNIEQIQNPET